MIVRHGNTLPRIFTPPLARGPAGPCGCGCALTPVATDDGEVTGQYVSGTSWGFSLIEFAEEVIGMRLHPWQRWLFIHALEVMTTASADGEPAGRFRFRKILILVARQNGKTSGVEIKNLWKLYVARVPLVIGTAQNLDVAEESWDKCIEIIEGTEDLKAELTEVIKVNGKKAFKLASGGRYKVQAANRRGGRGLAADDVNLDELREHQKWDAWGAVTKTTNAKESAQVWAFSNAGDKASVVLNDLQEKGRAAAAHPESADPSMGHFEWSAPDDTRCTCLRSKDEPHKDWCALLDRAIQAMANPSAGYPGGILWSALHSDAQTDKDEVFLTECLCVQVNDLSGKKIDIGRWRDLGDKHSRRHGDVALAVDISPDREWSCIAMYGERADGYGHLQVLDYLEGTSTLMTRLDAWRADLDPIAIGMQTATFKSLREALRKGKYALPGADDRDDKAPHRGDVLVIGAGENAAACGQLIDAVRQDKVRHVPSRHSEAAILAATTRKVGEAVAWAARDAESPILALTALTSARYAYHARIDLIASDTYDPMDDLY